MPCNPHRPAPSSPASALLFIAPDEDATSRLGAALAGVLESGTVIALVGNLGAGKTRLVRAVAEAAGVDRREIRSPTFVLVHEYEGRWPIYHFDTYRLHDVNEFEQLGAAEYFASAAVCIVEWADRVTQLLPTDHFRIEIKTTGDTSREFRFSATGPKSQRLVTRLAEALGSTRP
ncbi:MAG: tRNA (adenosine(37)-N6)-threonylcarbamoyltransferase complex ATPase subunit type 1 TsaE [Planctomycetaceae bacterium]|nr:tRNA (adenosine(37)-N6)-threonylcarbamoyltransferase complex ATPase subunit type 1 TsaE [Planctomycetaceae bacterium]